jgi:hypothetical protein
MRVPQSYIQKCKVVGHIFQSIFIFAGLCITIAVFTKDGDTAGATRYYLALVSSLSTLYCQDSYRVDNGWSRNSSQHDADAPH